MGVSYSADVFYGTFVPKDSAHGKKLSKMIGKFGGTLCPVSGCSDVALNLVGNNWGGGQWITIQLTEPRLHYDRDEGGEPRRIERQWPERIEYALGKLRILANDVPPIDWYLAASVW